MPELAAYVLVPDVRRQDLVLLIEVEYLYESHAVVNSHHGRLVKDRPADHAHPVVLIQKVPDESLLIRQVLRLV